MAARKPGTRLKLTYTALVVLTILSFAAIIAGMEQVALAGVSSIGLLGGGYQLSQGYTKAQYIKTNPTDKNLEG